MHQKQKQRAMRNTDYNISALSSIISTEASFQALQGLIDDLGLELGDVTGK